MMNSMNFKMVSGIKNQLRSSTKKLEEAFTFLDLEPEMSYKHLALLEEKMRKGEFKKVTLQDTQWLRKGKITIKDLKVKYRKDLDYVIKGVSLVVKAGEKIGIVGRTGAGKTTFLTSIYNSFENYEGSIKIDDMEIREIDLKHLRMGMAIIPQDPHFFEDTIKNNLDPHGLLEDETIITILEDLSIWKKFSNLKGLETVINSGGLNLSQGEKQLLCLVRALSFDKKLILLDEATANIDVQTEIKIQKMITEQFKDSTVVMIAHRLNTVMHCDKILVLEDGVVQEFEEIEKTKDDTGSIFGRMVQQCVELQDLME